MNKGIHDKSLDENGINDGRRKKMTKKQCISIGALSAILSAILTGVFLYAGYYFPHRLVKFLFCIVTVAFCFGFFT